MGALKIVCDKCGRDLVPVLLEVLNAAHETDLTVMDVLLLAEELCRDPQNCAADDAQVAVIEDLGLYLVALLSPQPMLCDLCGKPGVPEPIPAGRQLN